MNDSPINKLVGTLDSGMPLILSEYTSNTVVISNYQFIDFCSAVNTKGLILLYVMME